MWKHNEYLCSVQKALSELGGVCQRCVLRLGGVKSSKEHRNVTIEDDMTKEAQNVPSKSSVSISIASTG